MNLPTTCRLIILASSLTDNADGQQGVPENILHLCPLFCGEHKMFTVGRVAGRLGNAMAVDSGR